jgi:hypothetical protein
VTHAGSSSPGSPGIGIRQQDRQTVLRIRITLMRVRIGICTSIRIRIRLFTLMRIRLRMDSDPHQSDANL